MAAALALLLNKKANPMAKPQVRTLKVYDKIFYRGGRAINNRYSIQVPEIRLIGKWLQACGFQPGQHITVTTERNKLTIEPALLELED